MEDVIPLTGSAEPEEEFGPSDIPTPKAQSPSDDDRTSDRPRTADDTAQDDDDNTDYDTDDDEDDGDGDDDVDASESAEVAGGSVQDDDEKAESSGAADGPVHDYTSAFNHLRVYLAADKYDIPALKVLAKKNYMEWIGGHDDDENMADIIRRTMHALPSHDHDFPNAIAEFVGDNLGCILEWDDAEDVFRQFASLSIDVLPCGARKMRSLQRVLSEKDELIGQQKANWKAACRFFESLKIDHDCRFGSRVYLKGNLATGIKIVCTGCEDLERKFARFAHALAS